MTLSLTQPHRPIVGVLWVILHLLLGALLGAAIGWGPLAAPTGGILVLAVGLATLFVGLAWWAWRVQRIHLLLWGHVGILLLIGGISLVPLYRVGTFPPPSQAPEANLRRLLAAMAYAYPYAEEKGIDWGEVEARYLSRASQIEGHEAYWRVVSEMLAELNDGHTGVTRPSPQANRRTFALCRDVAGTIVLAQLGETAREAGLARGDQVLAVDGLPVERALEALPPGLASGSTSHGRRYVAALHLLSTTADTMRVTVLDAQGQERTVELVWPADPVPESEANTTDEPLIRGERLASGVGLIRLPTFGAGTGHALVAEFDAALDALMDAPGLILDVRGNGGGSTMLSDPMAGRLMTDPFVYGREYFRARLPQRGVRPWFSYGVRPRGRIYPGPVVVLTDAGTFSTAENFVVALVDSGRAVAVGRQTAGASGNPVSFVLPGGGRARFSTGDFRRKDGTPIEGIGIAPDIPVTWTVDELRQGLDPDLSAAEAWLAQQGP